MSEEASIVAIFIFGTLTVVALCVRVYELYIAKKKNP